MTKCLFAAVLVAAAVGVPAGAGAQGLTAVRPIPGYTCMRLNLSAEQMMDRNLSVPVLTEPSAQSARIGEASATLIVREPMHVQNGFAEILFLDGRKAWIRRELLRPYATPAAPNARCTPSIMSNGRPGFAG